MFERVFKDRKDAGLRLAKALRHYKEQNPVVLALPRGGVPVAFEVALALAAPLDLVFVRKIGAPFQPELAVAAVVDGDHPDMAVNTDIVAALGISKETLEREKAAKLKEIARRRELYLRGRPQVPLAGKTAIVIDDGIATGATMRAALAAVRRAGPKRLVLAVPVAPPDTIAMLGEIVDDVICLEQPHGLGAIGAYYEDFRQLDDSDVVDYLDRAAARAAGDADRG